MNSVFEMSFKSFMDRKVGNALPLKWRNFSVHLIDLVTVPSCYALMAKSQKRDHLGKKASFVSGLFGKPPLRIVLSPPSLQVDKTPSRFCPGSDVVYVASPHPELSGFTYLILPVYSNNARLRPGWLIRLIPPPSATDRKNVV